MIAANYLRLPLEEVILSSAITLSRNSSIVLEASCRVNEKICTIQEMHYVVKKKLEDQA